MSNPVVRRTSRLHVESTIEESQEQGHPLDSISRT